MNVDVVMSPNLYTNITPEFTALMTGFEFRQGSRYADFAPGDKVAAYGLTALIAGGAGAVAMKTGLIVKMWKYFVFAALALKKVLIAVIVGIGAFFKKLWAKIRGRREEQPVQSPTPDLQLPSGTTETSPIASSSEE